MTGEPAVLAALVAAHLPRWGLPPDTQISLISHSENHVYLLQGTDGSRRVLRLARSDYQTRASLDSELLWMQALGEYLADDESIAIPKVLRGCDGNWLQVGAHRHLTGERYLVLFEYVAGQMPDLAMPLTPYFERLGAVTARLHRHAMHWPVPAGFTRFSWGQDAFFGAQPIWGPWQQGPGLDAAACQLIGRAAQLLCKRLARFGSGRADFGLVHADLRLANLLLDGDRTCVIDFDDCGFSWFLYDLAAAVSFYETHADIGQWLDAWLVGYRRHATLSAHAEHELASFILLRRLALLGWLGTHADTELAREHAQGFAEGTCLLAEGYLCSHVGH